MSLSQELRILLHRHIFEGKTNIKALSEKIGIHHNAVYRFMNGGDVKLSVVEKMLAGLDREPLITTVTPE